MKISTVGLFGKFQDNSVAPILERVRSVLHKRGLKVLLGSTTAADIDGERIDEENRALNEVIDIAMVVGGDGTMLSTARKLSRYRVPAVGVNLGRLGFLTDISLDELETSVDDILAGRFDIEDRTMLSVNVIRGNEVIYSGLAVNDAVLSKGNTGRLVEFETWVNDVFVSHTRSDGVIIATPTGSTAYSLSAGGPIIYPTLPVLSIAPICPHTLSNRPIMIDSRDRIRIDAIKTAETHVNLSLDGSIVREIYGDETLELTGAPDLLSMIRISSHDHFEVLRSKLGWLE